MSKENISETKPVQKDMTSNDAVEYNSHLAYFDVQSNLFIVEIKETLIPLNVFIQFIIQSRGEFIPMGMSYNPTCGKQRQELAFMYKVPAGNNFNQWLEQLINQQKN